MTVSTVCLTKIYNIFGIKVSQFLNISVAFRGASDVKNVGFRYTFLPRPQNTEAAPAAPL